jgi:hypothetical protein
MRRGSSVIALTLAAGLCGCSASASARPAWPKPHPRDSDGGESLAPRAAPRAVAAAAVEDDRAVERVADRPSDIAPVLPASVSPAPAAPAEEEPITAEDIVIEVDGGGGGD